MATIIQCMSNNGNIDDKKWIYSLDKEEALISFLEQFLDKNYNVFEYSNSKYKSKIKKCKTACYYVDKDDTVYGAMEYKPPTKSKSEKMLDILLGR